jgi:glycosyltransferase involved in cell wall biosynthesis
VITVIYDNLGYSFVKVARLLDRGLRRVGYTAVSMIPLHGVYYVPSGLSIIVYDTKLYERRHRYVRSVVNAKRILWLDSPASPSSLDPRVYEDSCHVTTLPYWYREYRRHGIPVSGWVPRPIDYDAVVEVSKHPRGELCRDLWLKYGRYIVTVGSDNVFMPSRPPRKGLDAYDKLCEEIRLRHDVRCLYIGNWVLKNTVKVSGIGGLSEHDLLKLMRCSEVFVWASRGEGFGLPPVEAMSVGSLVVSSNAPFNEHVVGVKFNYTSELEAWCPEVGFSFRLFDYDVGDLVDAVDYALSMPEDEREELRIKAGYTREIYRPDSIALALTQV